MERDCMASLCHCNSVQWQLGFGVHPCVTWPHVTCHPVTCHPALCHLSPGPMSPVTQLFVTCHPAICHLSPGPCHISHGHCHLSPSPLSPGSCPLCYLPMFMVRLVLLVFGSQLFREESPSIFHSECGKRHPFRTVH